MSPQTVHPIPAAAERFFANHAALPTMPEVANRLLKSFDDPNVSMAQLADLIAKDPTLSAKVLRLANSARYSPSHTIGTLKDAANALGMDLLRNLSMAAAISGSFPAIQGLDRKAFWRHAVSTAAYARLLAKLVRLDADEVYLAGLMLRTGELLMAMTDPAQVADVETHAKEPGSRYSLEQSRFGCTHADVTASLAAHWHFPQEMVQAFTDANDPMAVRPFSLMAAVLHLSEVLADAHEHHDDPVAALQAALPELIEHLHLDLDDLRQRLEAAGDVGSDVDALIS
ncbi:HD-like signal output (HDOD) protein [Inhella inkyongensis]|uniref:HD-like signal output (HDOD) protein n=1 Tax=Inhella inkyongensis TaxID=392593 RepID=A0A840S1Z0_9BURK|nr:HDOD domain-containing protein [Inhella inkyongensis]MBB5203542.1 HD-like signal output (HDOD) protein [Inhella inkyongensis]